ncbi:nascent polypeptide-associated complex subunit alpha, muscle-specific form isoform X2 [Helicoverpa armigera]|uniref:nascent polypeptide-associated complex subunit alpha, muscle-specific form isoform X2 n=1 Tax=Helicoverpa armigera TaxID=29058 RepID=UPI0030833244
MSGGSQHNPNGRQSQLGSGWSPLQLQVANLLARAPQAHMASDRGVTWHTPTPPPHLYHVPAPSPPDPLQGLLQLQALKSAGGNSVFRHTATPPELYRHTPTPPDKHHMRHTPSPGDIKANAALPPDIYQHLGQARADKLRADELMAYTRVGVDLSLGGGRASNGAATSPAPGAHAAPPALSVRDAPTINSLIARAAPRHHHARVDALLERLAPSPVSPHSVIVHSRAAPTPSPPSSNEDSADSCGAPPGSKRKRKPERTVRVAAAPPPPALAAPPPATPAPAPPPAAPRVSPPPSPPPAPAPRENGDAAHAKADVAESRAASPPPDLPHAAPRPDQPHARRKTRSGSAETIDDIAAMIADTDSAAAAPPPAPPAPAVTVDKLRSVLASPDAPRADPAPDPEPPAPPAPVASPTPPPAPAAPRRRSARTSNPEAPNVPVESPSEAKPAEPEASDAHTAEPAAASFVEVENQLEKMFAGLEEEPLASPTAAGTDATAASADEASAPAAARKRRKSAPARAERRQGRVEPRNKKAQRKKAEARRPRKGPRDPARDAYDSGSNASSSKSRGPYIQIRGPRDSPLSVSVMNTTTGEEEDATSRRKGGEEFRNGVRGVRGLHASTLGLRYDASTPDASWLCAFCARGPHACALGDLFGPYALDTDCDEYRSLDEATRRRYCTGASGAADEVWFHEACAVWAPGLVACGARVWGLPPAVWGARAARCGHCGAPGAALACGARGCVARAHLPCARPQGWALHEDEFRAACPHHAS